MAVILAHRAHAFEKLEQYDMMLADAQQVVQCFPTSAHGYLQTARAFCYKDQLRDALLVYENGLQAVSSEDPLYQTMVSLKEDMAAQINQRNLCQLGQLPYDVFDKIFSGLSLIDRTRCTWTCKGWRNMLHNWHNMWTTVNVKYPKRTQLRECLAQIDGRHARELSIDQWSREELLRTFELLLQKGYDQLQKLGNTFRFTGCIF